MIRKIISGGQEGAERAALDVARRMGIEISGHIPKWMAEEEPSLISDYHLELLSHGNYVQATEQNILAADGVLIFLEGEPTGSSALNQRLASQHNRPSLSMAVDQKAAFEAAGNIESWVSAHAIENLAVTGPKIHNRLDLYETVTEILETFIRMIQIEPMRYISSAIPMRFNSEDRLSAFIRIPKTVKEAVEILLETLSFHDRTRIAHLSESRLSEMSPSLGMYIKNEFRLWGGNEKLAADCRSLSRGPEDDVADVIIRALWESLKRSGNVLRRIK